MKTQSLFGNATTAQVLALLSSMPGQELHTNEIIRRIQGNPNAVQRALTRSEGGGLIQSRRLGNLRLWSMDPDIATYGSMRELFARTRGVPAHLAAALEKAPGVTRAFLFGSYVTAQDDPTSDIDLFVVGAPDWVSLSSALRSAGRQLGRTVNPIVWTEGDFAHPAPDQRAFLDSVLRGPMMSLVGSRSRSSENVPGMVTDLELGRPKRAPIGARRKSATAEGRGSPRRREGDVRSGPARSSRDLR